MHGFRVTPVDIDGKPVLTEAVRRLVQALHPERIYLFGSQARGEATEESDWDLMVLVESPGESRYELTRTAYEALFGVGVPIDVLVWPCAEFEWQTTAAASLPATILREGQLVYAA